MRALRASSLTVIALAARSIVACSASNDDPSTATSATPAVKSASTTSGTLVGIGGLCVDVDAWGTANGTKVQLWSCNGGANQSFTYEAGQLVGVASGKCLDIADDDQVNGTTVRLWSCNQTAAQQWSFDGVQIKSTKGFCLNATGGSDAEGTPLQIATCANPVPSSESWHYSGSVPPSEAGVDASPPPNDASTTGSDTGTDAAPSKDASAEGGPGDSGPRDSGLGDGDAGVADAAAKQPFKGVAGGACSTLTELGTSWWYNWGNSPSGCTTPPFVPMVWGSATSSAISTEVSGFVSSGYPYVLGFNEPDNASQSNISVATAISLWPAFNNKSILIGSPATQGNGTGLAWIQSFMSQVNADTTGTLRVDFIATHWYGWNTGSCDPAASTLESWIEGIEAIPGDRPIWLTEWGCLNDSDPNAATVEAFYAGALAMFARHPRLVRYAWYQWAAYDDLFDSSGALTTLGTAYADAPAYH